ncbi:hypothetical protein EBZ35_05040 [bacterium]|nr:hypothetical protein [bacterium]
MAIRFGTSGYRGVMGDTFDASHVRALSSAIAAWVVQQPTQRVLIGYDPRLGNDDQGWVGMVARTMANWGIEVAVSDVPIPTPVISRVIQQEGYTGGIILTASHNPPQYNGIKFNPYPGGPAPLQVTDQIEALLAHPPIPPVGPLGTIRSVSLVRPFVAGLRDWLGERVAISPDLSWPVMVADARHGTAAAIWHEWSCQVGQPIEVIHASPQPDFGGLDPNPLGENQTMALAKTIQATGAAFGVAHDPDADRHVILDEKGQVLSPETVACLVAEAMPQLDGLVSTLASSGLVKRMADGLGVSYEETAVGFKWFTPVFESANREGRVVLGVESSGGISQSDYTYEKCGFLPAVWVSWLLSQSNRSLSEWVQWVNTRWGKSVMIEQAYALTDEVRLTLSCVTAQDDWAGAQVSLVDGIKWSWVDRWGLVRPSGTEPVVRVMVEAPTLAEALGLLQACQQRVGLFPAE